MKIDFFDYNKLYFERMSWTFNLLVAHKNKSINNFWTKECKMGLYSVLLFDNFNYYTGAVIEKTNDLKVFSPNALLNISSKPVHWKKQAEKYFGFIKAFANTNDYNNINLIIMDLRHFIRIINSNDPMSTFFKLTYNGVIYSELHFSLWLKLKLKYRL